MAVQTRDTLKSWFETFDYPTQEQFSDFIDSFLVKGEVSIDDIFQLKEILQSKVDIQVFEAQFGGERIAFNEDGFYIIPANHLLEKVLIKAGADATIRFGYTDNGGEIHPGFDVLAGKVTPLTIDEYGEGNLKVFINGIPGDTVIIFIKRLIKF